VLEKRIACDVVMVPFDTDDRYLPKHPDVARINPKGQVPVLIDTRDGEVVELFDSTQIFEYLEDIQPEPRLWPEALAARARARQLELMCDEVLFAQVLKLFSLQDAMQSDAAVAACAACAAFYDEPRRPAGHAGLSGRPVLVCRHRLLHDAGVCRAQGRAGDGWQRPGCWPGANVWASGRRWPRWPGR
jgi:glutathione S-transferase